MQLKDNIELAKQFRPTIQAKGFDMNEAQLAQIVGAVKSRVTFANELWEQTSFYFVAPTQYDEKAVQKRWKPETKNELGALVDYLKTMSDADFASVELSEKLVISWIETSGYNMGNVMNPFRLSLVGEMKGPHIFDITAVLGKAETIRRIQTAIEKLG